MKTKSRKKKNVWVGWTDDEPLEDKLKEIIEKHFELSGYIAEGVKHKDIFSFTPKKIRITVEAL